MIAFITEHYSYYAQIRYQGCETRSKGNKAVSSADSAKHIHMHSHDNEKKSYTMTTYTPHILASKAYTLDLFPSFNQHPLPLYYHLPQNPPTAQYQAFPFPKSHQLDLNPSLNPIDCSLIS